MQRFAKDVLLTYMCTGVKCLCAFCLFSPLLLMDDGGCNLIGFPSIKEKKTLQKSKDLHFAQFFVKSISKVLDLLGWKGCASLSKPFPI